MKKHSLTILFLALLPLAALAQGPLAIPEGEYFRFEITTAEENQTFAVPTGGYIGGKNTDKEYNWSIDWGDGSEEENATGTQNETGVPHIYAEAGVYTITITPAGSNEAWFAAFGFASTGTSFAGAKIRANRNMLTKVISPLTPLMTRTNAQIAGTEPPPEDEWADTFASCDNLTMGDEFTFSKDWDDITAVGNNFASGMFGYISGDTFTMGAIFNLPQGIITVGNYFASSMFSMCSGAAFNMNLVFNLPQSITTVGHYFASDMFQECGSDVFTMNEVFTFPQGITTVGDKFASEMFEDCRGAAFTMNEVFNLPQEITTVEDEFVRGMFKNSYGDAFTMNKVFNLPQGITTVGDYFVAEMFSSWIIFNGDDFTMNEVFNLPQGITIVGSNFASNMFSGCNGAFNMNLVFNLPQSITTVGDYFAERMFSSCNGAAFTMNEAFNLPQGIATVGDYFAESMFSYCEGNSFMINDVFKFPILTHAQINKKNMFYQTFRDVDNMQNRTALSIINGNFVPEDKRYTFSFAFLDLRSINVNWGGEDTTPPTPILLQIANGKIKAQTIGNTITLQNLPLNSKVEVYNLKGNRIYSGNTGNISTLDIGVKAKGMYIVKTSFGSEKEVMRVVVR